MTSLWSDPTLRLSLAISRLWLRFFESGCGGIVGAGGAARRLDRRRLMIDVLMSRLLS
jgi:hypothetical protein